MSNKEQIIKESAALLSQVKSLDNQRTILKQQIEAAKETIEKQKRLAEHMSALMRRDDLPNLEDTKERLNELREQIDNARQFQNELRAQSQQIQDRIDYSIAVRDKRSQYDKIVAEVRKLSNTLEEEKQKENELKLKHSHLSSVLLKNQQEKRSMEQRMNTPIEPSPEIEPIKKKHTSLAKHIELVQTKKEAFEQELQECMIELTELRKKREQLDELNTKVESFDPEQLQNQILAAASNNMDLRRYHSLKPGTDKEMSEIRNLIDEVSITIEQVRKVVE